MFHSSSFINNRQIASPSGICILALALHNDKPQRVLRRFIATACSGLLLRSGFLKQLSITFLCRSTKSRAINFRWISTNEGFLRRAVKTTLNKQCHASHALPTLTLICSYRSDSRNGHNQIVFAPVVDSFSVSFTYRVSVSPRENNGCRALTLALNHWSRTPQSQGFFTTLSVRRYTNHLA